MPRRLERNKPHTKYILSDGTETVGASTIAGINKPVDPLRGWAARLAREGKDWRKERDMTADVGHLAHFMIECHLAGEEMDLSEYSDDDIHTAQLAFEKFMNYWTKNDVQIVASELILVSDKLRYGGTLDLLGIQDEDLILFDWKTSKQIYDSHLMQAVGYKKLFENRNLTPMERAWTAIPKKIKKVCIVRVGRDVKSNFQQKWIEPAKINKYWACFKARLAVYNADRALKNEKHKTNPRQNRSQKG